MNLQTKISLRSQEPKINYNSEMVMLGSCFAENIGNTFEYFKFKNAINPFGILFHTKAIETFLWMATQEEEYTETDVFTHNERWHCFDAHSSLSDINRDTLVSKLNQILLSSKKKIGDATHIFITLGTSWVYRLKSMDMIVANCHKISQKEFTKELLSIQDNVQSLQNCIHMIRSVNQDAKIVFTVSPVRHAKDGFVANTRSKSHLISAVHQVIEETQNTTYFPAYELMMDELREYRFYDTDMLHPSKVAIQYLWNRFSEVWMSKETFSTMQKVEEIRKGMAHRPFDATSKQHQAFLENLDFKKYQLQERYPFIIF